MRVLITYLKKILLVLRDVGTAIAKYFKLKLSSLRGWLRRNLAYFAVFFLILTLCFAFFFPDIIITVQSGEGGVLFRRFFGTDTEKVYTEGIYAIFPWDTIYIYDARIQTVLHDFDVLTTEGLTIHLSLAIRFRPEYDMLGLLHQQVGPDYINTIITPEVESVLRKRLSPYKPEDIYKNKDKILTTVVIEAMEALGQKYIIANDVIIREIALPTAIVAAIEDKLKEEQHEQAYVYKLKREKQEAERKVTEATGIKNYQDTVSKSLTDKLLKWQGIQATLELAKSTNSKVVVIGAGNSGMPLILGSDYSNNSQEAKSENEKKATPAQVEKSSSSVENASPEPANDAN